MDSRPFEAGHLGDSKSLAEGPDVHHRLDLEPDAVESKSGQDRRPERVVSVAEVGKPPAEEKPNKQDEAPVAERPEPRYVGRSAVAEEARALGEVSTIEEGVHETWDLDWISRTVRVQHDDDVAFGGAKPRAQSRSLATTMFDDDADRRQQGSRHVDRPVDRSAVDKDHLMNVERYRRQDMRKIAGLVDRRDDDGNPGPPPGFRQSEVTSG